MVSQQNVNKRHISYAALSNSEMPQRPGTSEPVVSSKCRHSKQQQSTQKLVELAYLFSCGLRRDCRCRTVRFSVLVHRAHTPVSDVLPFMQFVQFVA